MEENKIDILVIDDNIVNLRLLDDMLSSQGFSVKVAHGGQEGIKQAEHLLPKLILLDVQMPKMGGKEVLKELKRTIPLKHTPVIAVTALAMPTDEQAMLKLGFDAYISKPVRLKALTEIVSSFVN